MHLSAYDKKDKKNQCCNTHWSDTTHYRHSIYFKLNKGLSQCDWLIYLVLSSIYVLSFDKTDKIDAADDSFSFNEYCSFDLNYLPTSGTK